MAHVALFALQHGQEISKCCSGVPRFCAVGPPGIRHPSFLPICVLGLEGMCGLNTECGTKILAFVLELLNLLFCHVELGMVEAKHKRDGAPSAMQSKTKVTRTAVSMGKFGLILRQPRLLLQGRFGRCTIIFGVFLGLRALESRGGNLSLTSCFSGLSFFSPPALAGQVLLGIVFPNLALPLGYVNERAITQIIGIARLERFFGMKAIDQPRAVAPDRRQGCTGDSP